MNVYEDAKKIFRVARRFGIAAKQREKEHESMNTHERREALLGWLRRRTSGTAAQAADHFGVTERTILRDVGVLRGRGEPILSSSGPGGGLYLDRSARLATVRLTVEEVVGLALAAGVARQMGTGLPYSLAADHAIDRLIRTLPGERAARFRELMQRIIVGQPASIEMNASMGGVESELLRAFELSLSDHVQMAFTYTDRHGKQTARTIEPYGLFLRIPIWYVVAYDSLRDAPRLFRIDRISDVRLLTKKFVQRPVSWLEEYLDPEELRSFSSNSRVM